MLRRLWWKDYLIFLQGQQILISRLCSSSRWVISLRRRLGKTILISTAYRINAHYLHANFGRVPYFLIHCRIFFKAKDASMGDVSCSLPSLHPAWVPTLTGLSASGEHAIAKEPFHADGSLHGLVYYMPVTFQKGTSFQQYLFSISPDRGIPFTIRQGPKGAYSQQINGTYHQRNRIQLAPVTLRRLSRHEGYKGVIAGQSFRSFVWGERKEGVPSDGPYIPLITCQGSNGIYHQRNSISGKSGVLGRLSRHEGYSITSGHNAGMLIRGERKEGVPSDGPYIPLIPWQGSNGIYHQRNSISGKSGVLGRLSRYEGYSIPSGHNAGMLIRGGKKEERHSDVSFISHPLYEGRGPKEGTPSEDRVLGMHDILPQHERIVPQSANGNRKNAKVRSEMVTHHASISGKLITGRDAIEPGKERGHGKRVEVEDVNASTDAIVLNALNHNRPQRYVPVFMGRRETTDHLRVNTVYPISPYGQTERRAEERFGSGLLHPQEYPQPAPHEIDKMDVFETTVRYNPVHGRKDFWSRGDSIDYQKIADHVYDMLTRRIVRERERMEGLL